MLNLRRADAVGQSAECAVGGCVTVAAHNGHAGQCPALFRANDVHDALADVVHWVIDHTEFFGVFIQRFHLNAGFFVVDAIFTVPRGGNVVIWHGDGFFGCANLAPGHAQSFEGLGAGHLVHQMTVDIKQASAIIGLMRNMRVPDFVIKRFASHVIAPIESGKK